MKDQELALEIINRLNKMIADDESGIFKKILYEMFSNRTRFIHDKAKFLEGHDSIQCMKDEKNSLENHSIEGDENELPDVIGVGFLGLLNGLVGVRSNGWGYIAAIFQMETKTVESFGLLQEEEKTYEA